MSEDKNTTVIGLTVVAALRSEASTLELYRSIDEAENTFDLVMEHDGEPYGRRVVPYESREALEQGMGLAIRVATDAGLAVDFEAAASS